MIQVSLDLAKLSNGRNKLCSQLRQVMVAGLRGSSQSLAWCPSFLRAFQYGIKTLRISGLSYPQLRQEWSGASGQSFAKWPTVSASATINHLEKILHVLIPQRMHSTPSAERGSVHSLAWCPDFLDDKLLVTP